MITEVAFLDWAAVRGEVLKSDLSVNDLGGDCISSLWLPGLDWSLSKSSLFSFMVYSGSGFGPYSSRIRLSSAS